jgi:hypothetical protein
MPGQFGDSYIYVNTTAFAELDTNTTIKMIAMVTIVLTVSFVLIDTSFFMFIHTPAPLKRGLLQDFINIVQLFLINPEKPLCLFHVENFIHRAGLLNFSAFSTPTVIPDVKNDFSSLRSKL